MGTTLYFQVEAATQKSYRRPGWWHFARVRLPDDYLLFAFLAGVRREEFANLDAHFLQPKGLPEDVTSAALDEDRLMVSDEGAELDFPSTCSLADADNRVKAGLSRWLDDGEAITHPDAHAHSWATSAELDTILQRYEAAGGTNRAPLKAVIAMMQSLEASGLLSRAIFWFI